MSERTFIWRINPKQCDYKKMRTDNEIFCSAWGGVPNLGIRAGDIIVPIASGSNKAMGVLGLWRVTQEPELKKLFSVNECWVSPYKKTREKKQWRVPASKMEGSATLPASKLWKIISPDMMSKFGVPQLLERSDYDKIYAAMYVEVKRKPRIVLMS